ncbi:MAG: CDP-diacylglycerol--glycerol-3-phosphate 3-phosphatidyltransferase [Spirochaetaceae bacterium]|nr:CDP-diacylglycerol--glycerol-3-phosphate 3-phosphatidyltransferase [Spirochaetaceae bacterium]|tara:strand:- start:24561 stop:25172 length:612 start_codon:yes stop_codon:yes gene_type:complete
MKFRDAFQENYLTLSNFLSVSRVLLVPPFLYLGHGFSRQPENTNLLYGLLVIVFIAIITDFLDGFLARRWNQVTMVGQYLDPICDKIVTLAALTLLLIDFDFPMWIYAFYWSRELAGVWAGTFLYFKRDVQGKPNIWGKIGVFVVGLCTTWYLLNPLLKQHLSEGHWLTQPVISAYILALVLVLGIISYTRSYGKLVFKPDSK